MQTHIIVSTWYDLGREALESVENKTFNSNVELCEELKSDKFKLYSMSDFTKLINDDNEFKIDDHLIGYVNMPEGYYYI